MASCQNTLAVLTIRWNISIHDICMCHVNTIDAGSTQYICVLLLVPRIVSISCIQHNRIKLIRDRRPTFPITLPNREGYISLHTKKIQSRLASSLPFHYPWYLHGCLRSKISWVFLLAKDKKCQFMLCKCSRHESQYLICCRAFYECPNFGSENYAKSVRQVRRQSVKQSVNQSVSQSVSRSVLPVSQSISQSVKQSVSQSVGQLISQSVNQSVSQTVSQSVTQSVSQSVCKLVSCLLMNIHFVSYVTNIYLHCTSTY